VEPRRPASMPTDGEFQRWQRGLRAQSRWHKTHINERQLEEFGGREVHLKRGIQTESPQDEADEADEPPPQVMDGAVQQLRELGAMLKTSHEEEPDPKRNSKPATRMAAIAALKAHLARVSINSSGDPDMGNRQAPMAALRRGFASAKRLSLNLSKERPMSKEAERMQTLYTMAKKVGLPMQTVLLAKSAFTHFDRDESGVLDSEEFGRAALELVQEHRGHLDWDSAALEKHIATMTSTLVAMEEKQVEAEEAHPWGRRRGSSNLETHQEPARGRPRGYSVVIASSRSQKPIGIDFEQFLVWYCQGVEAGMLLTEHQRLGQIAATSGVNEDYVIHLKRCFDACTSGQQPGFIDGKEFAQVLHKALKVPANQELPLCRVQRLWADLAAGSADKVPFKEFLQWWLRNFDEECDDGVAPFEAIYGQVRRVGHGHLDPPAAAGQCNMVPQPAPPKKPAHGFRHRNTM